MHRLVHRAAPAFAGLLLSFNVVAAPSCFPATGKVGDDAQTIRLQAETLGWSVGVPASVTAGTAVKTKVVLYPKGNVAVCLSGDSGALAFRAQASTGDDRDAAWHKLPAKRKGA